MNVLTCPDHTPLTFNALWGTFIHTRRYKMHNEHKLSILETLRKLKRQLTTPYSRPENLNLFESSYDLFERCAEDQYFRAFVDFVRGAFRDVAHRVNQDYWHAKNISEADVSLRIVDSWFIEYGDKGFVLPHAHGGSWSCVYYLQVGEIAMDGSGSTYLLSPRGKMDDRHDLGNSYLSSSTFLIPANEGELVIFPSHIIHGSVPTSGNKKKVIISANAEFARLREAPELKREIGVVSSKT